MPSAKGIEIGHAEWQRGPACSINGDDPAISGIPNIRLSDCIPARAPQVVRRSVAQEGKSCFHARPKAREDGPRAER